MLTPLRTLLCLSLLAFLSAPASADDYADTIKIFKEAGESARFFKNSYGYAVFPTIGKGGLVAGGAHGSGRVYEKGVHVGDVSMTQVTVGLQLGGQAFSEIIFFEDKRALDEFRNGNFEFGAEASATMITSDATAQTSTSGSSAGASGGQHDATTTGAYYKGMATFIVAKGGAMADASVGGQKFSYKPITK
jgi:lipid-binding SYLF domain-containing protein